MPSHRLLAAPLLGLALLAAACGSGDDPTMQLPDSDASSSTAGTAPTTTDTTEPSEAEEQVRTIEVEVMGGRPVDGVRRERVARGEHVVIVITADAPDEVHVHGYDAVAPLAPGEATTIALTADLPGVWEVELHGTGQLLFELEVS
jgi:hypothetical protein